MPRRVEDFIFDGRQACLNEDPELFYDGFPEAIAEAKAVCRMCPVQPDCLTMAIARDEQDGIWGGKTHQEREKMNAGPSARRRLGSNPAKSSAA